MLRQEIHGVLEVVREKDQASLRIQRKKASEEVIHKLRAGSWCWKDRTGREASQVKGRLWKGKSLARRSMR